MQNWTFLGGFAFFFFVSLYFLFVNAVEAFHKVRAHALWHLQYGGEILHVSFLSIPSARWMNNSLKAWLASQTTKPWLIHTGWKQAAIPNQTVSLEQEFASFCTDQFTYAPNIVNHLDYLLPNSEKKKCFQQQKSDSTAKAKFCLEALHQLQLEWLMTSGSKYNTSYNYW
jgi:hypothetical protein